MKVKILTLIFKDMHIQPSDIPKVRGYFANRYKEYEILHNHLPGGKFNFGFPKLQYRIINHHPTLIAIKEGIDVLKEIFLEIENVSINGKSYNIYEREIFLREYDFGATEKFLQYKFLSPWMALNEENYRKYRSINEIERQNFLKFLLRENLKTLSKGFAYTIPDIEAIKVEGYFIPQTVKFKNVKMQCFKGNFTTNFFIPNLMGLGKQSARGFGVVKREDNQE